jgi:hypothetical protein
MYVMRHIEICKKSVVLNGQDESTIVYYITVDGMSEPGAETALESYGVGVTIVESGETAEIPNVTLSKDGILALAELLACHLVTPVTAGDVVVDWLSAGD